MYSFVVAMVIDNVYEMHVHMDKRQFLRPCRNHRSKSRNSRENDFHMILQNNDTYGILHFASCILIFSVAFFTKCISSQSTNMSKQMNEILLQESMILTAINSNRSINLNKASSNQRQRLVMKQHLVWMSMLTCYPSFVLLSHTKFNYMVFLRVDY